MTAATARADDEAPRVTILEAPADGIPGVVDTDDALGRASSSLIGGSGPVALDTERAQGFRYTAKAYLIQFRRAGAGTVLIDPTAFEGRRPRADFHTLADGLADAEWLLHAASQDLPCLAEVGLVPRRLFDTELAARLLGYPKVNLSTLMEQALGVGLRKEHSAADWSTRPLPSDWLSYAALDVERLVDLRDWLDDRLDEAGKREWAAQEFSYLVAHATDEPFQPAEPWRRTSGLHIVHTRRAMAVVRELWLARDAVAASLDRAPGRILADRAITDIASMFDHGRPAVKPDLFLTLTGSSQRRALKKSGTWLDAIAKAVALPNSALPAFHGRTEGPPKPRSWASKSPESAARWERVRPVIVERAKQLDLPVENLLAPDALRRLLWESSPSTSAAEVDARLAELDVRPWQREQVVDVIAAHW